MGIIQAGREIEAANVFVSPIPIQGDRDWLGGGSDPTFVDFYAYEILDHHRQFEPKELDKCANLTGYLARFEALPKVAEYRKSDRFKASPINSPVFAKWVG